MPFSRSVNKFVAQKFTKVLEIMKASKSTKVVLCFNKFGLHLSKLREDLASQEKPKDCLKQASTNELNEHYERNQQTYRLEITDIFFTDWILKGNESVKFGIIGVEEIKDVIKDYLVDTNIYKSGETDKLQRCVSFFSN